MSPGLPKTIPAPVTRFYSFFGKFQGIGSKFLVFFKGFAGKFALVGALVTSLLSLFSGESLARSLAQGAGPLFGAVLGAALTPFLGPLGPLIGGWIGSLEPVVSFLEGAFLATGEVFGSVMGSLSEVGSTLAAYLGDLWSIVTSLIPGLKGLGGEFSLLRAGVLAIKILLFPLTATMDALVVVTKGLRLAFLHIQRWASTLPFVGKAAGTTKEIDSKIAQEGKSFADTIRSIGDRYSWEQMSGAHLQNAEAAKTAARSAEQTAAGLNQTTQAAKVAAVNLKPLSAREAIAQGKASPTKPTPEAMAWYNNAKAALAVPPVVPEALTKFGNQVSSVSNVTEKNSSNQKKHLEETKASQAQALKTEAEIRAKWAAVNIGSQQLLLRSSGNLATAINQAAAKITVSADSVKKVSAMPAFTGYRPGASSGNKMSLGQAIATEMKNKPSGSHLLIANSSETVIPAARGYTPAAARGIAPLSEIGSSLNSFVEPTDIVGSMADALRKLADMDGIGGIKGSLAIAKRLATQMGLILTSFIRPYSTGSYHQVGRAMDFSDGVNTPGMMNFAKMMVSRYGRSLAELIYTPLGFSIKHGRKVPPLSPGNHYDHVHVAFGLGTGNPAFFSSQAAAQEWERKMMPTSAKVASVTTNSSEGFGNYTLNSPITIYQQPGQDPEELANIVATRLSMAISELRNHYA
jgi:hypothetical protein